MQHIEKPDPLDQDERDELIHCYRQMFLIRRFEEEAARGLSADGALVPRCSDSNAVMSYYMAGGRCQAMSTVGSASLTRGNGE